MKSIHFSYQFHAVGQGLFASGRLSDRENQKRFHWVFDCGTSSRHSLVHREIAHFTPTLGGGPIGLFCLSHFDEDHINGARDLLSRQRVEVLVMPYFPLVDRIQIAFASPGISEEYLRFLVDPAGYMFAAAGEGNLGEIIFITGSDASPETPEEGGPTRDPHGPDDRWRFDAPDTKLTKQPADGDVHGVSDRSSWRPVRVYSDKKPFTVGGVWEFMFYNEKILASKAAELRDEVAAIVKKYKNPDGSFDSTGLLRELKPIYVRKFGSSGIAKNRISLVAYSGPIGSRASHARGSIFPVGFEVQPWFDWWPWGFPLTTTSERVSIGYFGDFPLTTPERVEHVRQHFGPKRWGLLEVVQIPHHGSSHSWYDGASGEFQHRASVISSARCSAHHPSQSVLDDLATHGVLLVNEMQGASFYGAVAYP